MDIAEIFGIGVAGAVAVQSLKMVDKQLGKRPAIPRIYRVKMQKIRWR